MKSQIITVSVFLQLCLFFSNGLCQYGDKHTMKSERFPWPQNKQCAVSLTFDDARLSQIDKGIPLLNQYQVRATFYISPDDFIKRIEGWKAASLKGHEVGNHTMSHPCTGNYAFSRNNALEDYTLDQIGNEIQLANQLIQKELGITAKSFAYPCGQTFVGRSIGLKSYVPLVAETFETGRGWLGEDSNDPWICDMALLLGMESDNKSFEELLKLIEKARKEGKWLILAGHEMDDKGGQTTYLKTLKQFCEYTADEKNGIWVDTVQEIAEYIKQNR